MRKQNKKALAIHQHKNLAKVTNASDNTNSNNNKNNNKNKKKIKIIII